ncbi:MAG: hypothetical protein AAF320_00680 [Myxococcota bacterium]
MINNMNQAHVSPAAASTQDPCPFNNENILQQLHRAVTRHRLPQVVLFIGPSHQTETTSMQLAQALLCPNTSKHRRSTGCEQCNNCQRIAKQIHPNVHTLRCKENKTPSNSSLIGIEQVRLMKQQQNLRNFSSNPQIWLVPNAQDLTLQAASALLKLLEEPHTHRFIFLSTPNEVSLPLTVTSRCHKVFFPHNVKQQLTNADALQQANKLLDSIHKTPRLQRWHISKQFPTNRDELGKILQDMLLTQWQTTKQLCHQQPQSNAFQKSIVVVQALQETHEAVTQRNANSKLALENLLLRCWP